MLGQLDTLRDAGSVPVTLELADTNGEVDDDLLKTNDADDVCVGGRKVAVAHAENVSAKDADSDGESEFSAV